MSVLSAFTDQKKIRPVYQFKRGSTFSSSRSASFDSIRSTYQQPSLGQVGILSSSPGIVQKQQQSISPSSSSSSIAEEHCAIRSLNATPNSSTSTETTADVDDDNDSIFDFPDDESDAFAEIKVMVASNRIIPEAPKLSRKKSKSKKNATKSTPPINNNNKKKNMTTTTTTNSSTTKKRPVSGNHYQSLASQTIAPFPSSFVPINNTNREIVSPNHSSNVFNQREFDIFAFDPQPTSHLTPKKANYYSNTSSTATTASTSTSNTTINNNNNHNKRPNFKTSATCSSLASILPRCQNQHAISVASLLNEVIPTQTSFLTQQQPVEKKRKRNLIAHLKTARGETETKTKSQEFDSLSDEDDLILEHLQQQSQPQKVPLMPLKDIIKERSLSPELTYEETMQMQLDSLMRTEFGEYSSASSSTQLSDKTRREYQPLNKLNVRVTFQKK